MTAQLTRTADFLSCETDIWQGHESGDSILHMAASTAQIMPLTLKAATNLGIECFAMHCHAML